MIDNSIIQKTRWSRERLARLLTGISISIFLLLTFIYGRVWLIPLVSVGLNMLQSGITEKCLIKYLMVRMGIPGERDMGRIEGQNMVVSRFSHSGEEICA